MSETPSEPPASPVIAVTPTDSLKRARSERALEWLSSHWTAPQTCPICRSQQWAINDLVEMRLFQSGNVVMLGGPAYLMVPVMCRVCTYTFFFNAIAAGVLEPQASAPTLSGEGTLGAQGATSPAPASEGSEPGSPS